MPIEHDHIPSFASLKLQKEQELGRKLTPREEIKLKNEATAIEIHKDVHKESRTYKGKNTRSQIEMDANDLCNAQFCDLQILKENLLKRNYDERLVDEAINKVIERNKQMGIK